METPKLSPELSAYLDAALARLTRRRGTFRRGCEPTYQRVRGVLQEFRANPMPLAKLAEVKADIINVAHVLALARWRAEWLASTRRQKEKHGATARQALKRAKSRGGEAIAQALTGTARAEAERLTEAAATFTRSGGRAGRHFDAAVLWAHAELCQQFPHHPRLIATLLTDFGLLVAGDPAAVLAWQRALIRRSGHPFRGLFPSLPR